MLKKSPSTTISSLYSTVKKPKNNNQLQHAKSYDDIFSVQQLQPNEVKILLNNDKSLKNLNISAAKQTLRQKPYKIDMEDQQTQRYNISKTKQNKQTLSKILQQSVIKQNILVKKQLFDPFKYFGSSGNLANVQESTRHHQSRLEAMFSQNNSPLPTDHSASYKKKYSPKNSKKKVLTNSHRISNSVLLQKLQKLQYHEMKIKQKQLEQKQFKTKSKQNYDTNHFENIEKNKQNLLHNDFSSQKQSLYSTKKHNFDNTNHKSVYCYPIQQSSTKQKLNTTNKSNIQQSFSHHHDNKTSNYTTQNNQESLLSSKKISIQNYPRSHRPRVVNCSPKSYVKQTKQTYLKMNINNMQKVRLKLKLSSKN